MRMSQGMLVSIYLVCPAEMNSHGDNCVTACMHGSLPVTAKGGLLCLS